MVQFSPPLIVALLLLYIHKIYQQRVQSLDPELCNNDEKKLLEFIKKKIENVHEEIKTPCDEYHAYLRHLHPEYPANRHLLRFHLVCYDKENSARIKYVRASFEKADVVDGSKTTTQIRKEMKPYAKECGCDQIGHIVPYELSGYAEKANVFLQNGNLNAGGWGKVCKKPKTFLNDEKPNEKREVSMRIVFAYEDFDHPRRPSSFFYSFVYWINDKIVEEVYGFFENEDHYGSELKMCSADQNGIEKLYIVNNLDEPIYFAKKACIVPRDSKISKFYGLIYSHSDIKFSSKD